jgi:hypothetical protein
MLRTLLITAIAAIATGCATTKPQPVTYDARTAAPTVATALLFEPAPSLESSLLDLSREPRERGAFMGFEEQTASFYYLQVDDHQGSSGRDRYDRHDYVDRVGVTYR